ncbi:MAG: hypothetical protein JKP98_00565 [Rhodobacteraceae bacterium]|nr:hypothetical protein [Paracoccaceae bacterium]
MAALGSDATLFAPLGYAAAGAFGLLFAWRGARALRQGRQACCGHSHDAPGGTGRWRDRAALVAAIAVRPCGGAMIVLAVAFMAGAPWAGIAAALAMAAGVAAVTAAVALGGLAFRGRRSARGRGCRGSDRRNPADPRRRRLVRLCRRRGGADRLSVRHSLSESTGFRLVAGRPRPRCRT